MKIAIYSKGVCFSNVRNAFETVSGCDFVLLCPCCLDREAVTPVQKEMLTQLHLIFGAAVEDFFSALEICERISVCLADADVLLVSEDPALCWLMGAEGRYPLIGHFSDFTAHRVDTDAKQALVDSQTGSLQFLEYLAVGVCDKLLFDNAEIAAAIARKCGLEAERYQEISFDDLVREPQLFVDRLKAAATQAIDRFASGPSSRTSQMPQATEVLHESFSCLTSFQRFKSRRNQIISVPADNGRRAVRHRILSGLKRLLVRSFTNRRG